ncbi:hypothetical protein F5Y11DRAFT_189789 [Daldinia sp. FL1419]|nr:hypothetical protein F5Y11DRAFT_189789 [Daldinia sp. FL1419]
MSEAVDLAGVIGTRFGIRVGVIALIGIDGPILALLSSTERQQALEAIGREKNGYISPGLSSRSKYSSISTGTSTTPENLLLPSPFSSAIALDNNMLKKVDTKSTWINFSVLLEAFGIQLRRGNGIFAKDRKMYLLVHRF